MPERPPAAQPQAASAQVSELVERETGSWQGCWELGLLGAGGLGAGGAGNWPGCWGLLGGGWELGSWDLGNQGNREA